MPPESNETVKLVTPAQAGDASAQERLIDRIDSQVRMQAIRFQLPPEDRDDFFQEVMRRIHHKLGTLRQAAAFRGWVRQIGERVVHHFWRIRREGRNHVPDVAAENLAASETDVHRRLRRRELRELVGRFEEPRRTIFLLHLDEDLNYREISRRLQQRPVEGGSETAMTEGFVRYQLTKGIEELKWILRADFSTRAGDSP